MCLAAPSMMRVRFINTFALMCANSCGVHTLRIKAQTSSLLSHESQQNTTVDLFTPVAGTIVFANVAHTMLAAYSNVSPRGACTVHAMCIVRRPVRNARECRAHDVLSLDGAHIFGHRAHARRFLPHYWLSPISLLGWSSNRPVNLQTQVRVPPSVCAVRLLRSPTTTAKALCRFDKLV